MYQLSSIPKNVPDRFFHEFPVETVVKTALTISGIILLSQIFACAYKSFNTFSVEKELLGVILVLSVSIIGFVKRFFYQEEELEDSQISASLVIPVASQEVKSSFQNFIQELEEEIFLYYEQHESSFDHPKIHGRMHIARCIIFCEVIARKLIEKNQEIDFLLARRITGMHDSGRKGNGVDIWEKESADLLEQYLIKKGIEASLAKKQSCSIIKGENRGLDKDLKAEYVAYQSADCLDIIRVRQKSFDPNYLTFLKDARKDSADFVFRKSLVKEARDFVAITEKRKSETDFNKNKGFMKQLFAILQQQKGEFPILFSIIPETHS